MLTQAGTQLVWLCAWVRAFGGTTKEGAATVIETKDLIVLNPLIFTAVIFFAISKLLEK